MADNDATHMEAVGKFLEGQNMTLGALLNTLIFFLGDTMSQASDLMFDEAVFTGVSGDLRRAYTLCCTAKAPSDVTH